MNVEDLNLLSKALASTDDNKVELISYAILKNLAEGGVSTPGDIARKISRNASSVTGHLTRLSRVKLITRRLDPKDLRRVLLVAITKKGRAELGRIEGEMVPPPPAEIDEAFYRGENKPEAADVGSLKRLLGKLPDTMPLRAGFGDRARLVVYNHGSEGEHLELVDPEGD